MREITINSLLEVPIDIFDKVIVSTLNEEARESVIKLLEHEFNKLVDLKSLIVNLAKVNPDRKDLIEKLEQIYVLLQMIEDRHKVLLSAKK